MSLFNKRQTKMEPNPFAHGRWYEIEIFSDGEKITNINDPGNLINSDKTYIGYDRIDPAFYVKPDKNIIAAYCTAYDLNPNGDDLDGVLLNYIAISTHHGVEVKMIGALPITECSYYKFLVFVGD